MSTSKSFDPELYNNCLQTSCLGRPVLYLPSTTSTNDWVSAYPVQKLEHGSLVITDNQTNGKGQYERQWESEIGKNITCSLVLHPERSAGIHLLTMIVALSCLETFQDYTEIDGAIKWPNDIILGSRKIGGILMETTFLGSKLNSVIIGLGLNINQKKFPGPFENEPTSLAATIGHTNFSREEILAQCCLYLERRVKRWEAFDENQPKEVNEQLIGYGEWTRISINGEYHESPYKVIGIDGDGSLCLLNNDLEIVTFTHEQIRILKD